MPAGSGSADGKPAGTATDARVCDFGWILDIRSQCTAKNISFHFKQTGARFVKDGRLYRVARKDQMAQAAKAGIDIPRSDDL